MAIKFNTNYTKALQVLLWILNRHPGVDKYKIMKIVTAAEMYHLNTYGRPVYGDSYEAWDHGTVPYYMYGLTSTANNMPFHACSKNGLSPNAVPNMDMFSESDIEALEHGMSEYSKMPSFGSIRDKNHKLDAWKKYEKRIKAGEKRIQISYEDMITNKEVLADLQELGSLTLNMAL
jgi:uncharacterized phage-associated protein